MPWFVHWLIVAGSMLLAARIVPGIQAKGWGSALIAAAVLGLLNILVKPLLIILTLPLTIVTLGLFLFVVNAIVLSLVGYLVPGFRVKGFWAAVFGAVVISLFSWVGDALATRLFNGPRLQSVEPAESAALSAAPVTFFL